MEERLFPPSSSMTSVYYAALDLVMALAAAVALGIAVSGGGIVQLFGLRLSLTSVLNPLEAALLLAAFRARFGPRTFLLVQRFDLDRVAAAVLGWWRRRYLDLARLSSSGAAACVLLAAACSLGVKLYNAHVHFGFWTGDDVEIQEMTIAKLYGLSWPVWELRCAFYPLGFIYPAQALLKWAGFGDVQTLIFGSRVIVALWSTLDVWLTYRIAARVFRSAPIGILAALILAFSKLHVMSGSAELPRAVSTAFVLLAYGWLNDEECHASGALVAGAALGIAAAMRFSEEVFLVPAMFQLVWQRRWRAVVALTAAFAVAALVAIGGSDWMYWGQPFFSLRHILDYTLVRRQSSRGYQPFYEYAVHVAAWSNLLTVGLALFAIRLGQRIIAVWTWLPVLVLSVLPHKEARYLIPVLPFLSMSAAVGLWRVMTVLNGAETRADSGPRIARWSTALFLACVAAFVWEVAGFKFVRSESAVRLAQYLGRQPNLDGVAVEQLWRMGGRLYFPARVKLVDLDPAGASDAKYLADVFSDRGVRWAAMNAKDKGPRGPRGPDRALAEAGFREVELPAQAGAAGYRLYAR
jgi:hypothetical protein